ncbi:MAG: hypothetical protein K6B74_03860 [Ruminococcus sp.]|nr:hypothetical protein [Ruminococcus sp.]
MTKSAKITLIILVVCIAVCIAGGIVLSAADVGFEAVILAVPAAVLFLQTKKADKNGAKVTWGNPVGALIIAAFTLLLTFGTPPFINSRMKWQYPIQQKYISRFHNVKAPEYFPTSLEEVLGDYEFGYMPSIMQGTGYFSVTYKTTPERAAACAAEYAPQAKYTIPLKEYIEMGGYKVEDFTPRENSCDDGTLDVYISGKMREGGSESAQIYVLYAVLNWNHPHSTAVIVDTETGLVQFSQLG